MVFIDNLKKQLKENKRKILVKAPLSLLPESNWGYLSVTSLNGIPVMLGTPVEDLKIRFQPFMSGAGFCTALPYRMDNHSNKPLHTHFDGFESFVDVPTLSDALLMVLGSEFQELEK
jgi:hypothetical protein